MPIAPSGSASGGGGQFPSGQISTTPPASPSTGTQWIYPADDTNGVYWAFTYDAAETTYKWRFTGGPPIMLDVVPNAVLNTLTQVGATGYWYAATSAYTTVRAGDYRIWGWCGFNGNGAGSTTNIDVSAFSGSSQAGFMHSEMWLTGSVNNSLGCATGITGIAASTVIGLCASSGVTGTTKLVEQQVHILPVRVI